MTLKGPPARGVGAYALGRRGDTAEARRRPLGLALDRNRTTTIAGPLRLGSVLVGP